MNILNENYLTLQFNADGDYGDEVKLIKSVFKKVDAISSRAGFKRDFDPSEVEMIRALHLTLNGDDVKP